MNKTVKRAFAWKIVALAVCLGIGMSSATAAPKLDFSSEYNAGSIHVEGDTYFIEQVKELAGDEVNINLHMGGSLGYKSPDHFYAVADNAVQIADTLAAFFGGVDPILLLSSLPFIVDDISEAKALYEIARPEYDKVFNESGQILLYASPWPPTGIWAKKPIVSADSLKNLKIRTFDRTGTQVFKEAGAAPISLAWGDVVPQLATGGIEAVLTSADLGAAASFWEQQSDFSGVQYAVPLNMVHMNKEAFDELSEKAQAAILEAAKRTEARNWEAVRNRVAGNYETLAQHKVAIHDPIPDDFRQFLGNASKPAIAEWLKDTGERGQQVMSAFDAWKAKQ